MPPDDREITTDVALMLRVRGDDATAFEMLHERYQARLLHFFYGMSRDPQTTRELCQETFLRVWKVRRRYRAGASFPAYLFGVARMVWREHCRNCYREGVYGGYSQEMPDEDVPGSGASPSGIAMRHEVENHIVDALGQLPEDQRMAVIMRGIRGLSLADIARAMDCPMNTVRSRKLLGFRKLKHILEPIFHRAEDRDIQETHTL